VWRTRGSSRFFFCEWTYFQQVSSFLFLFFLLPFLVPFRYLDFKSDGICPWTKPACVFAVTFRGTTRRSGHDNNGSAVPGQKPRAGRRQGRSGLGVFKTDILCVARFLVHMLYLVMPHLPTTFQSFGQLHGSFLMLRPLALDENKKKKKKKFNNNLRVRPLYERLMASCLVYADINGYTIWPFFFLFPLSFFRWESRTIFFSPFWVLPAGFFFFEFSGALIYYGLFPPR